MATTADHDHDQTQDRASILLDFDQNAEHLWNQVRVRFRVEQTELLMSVNDVGVLEPGLPLFIPAFATFGMACLRLCRQVGHAALDLDDYGHELLFKIKDDDVLICSTMRRLTVAVDFEALFNAWESFANHVKTTVISKHPEKVNYGYWRLINHDPDGLVAKELSRQSWFDERKDCFQ